MSPKVLNRNEALFPSGVHPDESPCASWRLLGQVSVLFLLLSTTDIQCAKASVLWVIDEPQNEPLGKIGQTQPTEPESHPQIVRASLTVDGVDRDFIAELPRGGHPPQAIVLVFHGHGGTAERMRMKGFSRQWPEALLIYPRGLPTATKRDPEGKRSGWQNRKKLLANRDLSFFDSILNWARINHSSVDTPVFVTGHSNGGGFSSLLWAARGEQLAAIAISAGGFAEQSQPIPRPVFHLAGRNDQIVPFANQKRSVQRYMAINGAQRSASSVPGVGKCYAGKNGNNVFVHVHSGGHRYLVDAPERITKFFKICLESDDVNQTSSSSVADPKAKLNGDADQGL